MTLFWINMACANCGACRHQLAEFDPAHEDFGIHPVDEHLLVLWVKSHRGPVYVTSYEQAIVS